VFNGSRFRAEIAPRISDFILSNNRSGERTGKSAPANAPARAAKANGAAVTEAGTRVPDTATGPAVAK